MLQRIVPIALLGLGLSLIVGSGEAWTASAALKRAENVSIQILTSANGQGEIGECE